MFTFPCQHDVSCIENLGSFSNCIFSQKFIAVKIYFNKVAALEHYHTDMFVLKRLSCNSINGLTWFICVEALSQPEVLF